MGARDLKLLLLMLVLWVLAAPVRARPERVGRVLYARGAVTASLGSSVRLLGNASPIFQGDVLTTGHGSFALIRFEDDTRMTLRPNSVFKVDRIDARAHHESMFLTLFKGGLRAITGLITRRSSRAFKLHTPVATIGVRGTDFTARLCTERCVQAQQRLAAAQKGATKPPVRVGVVGRVAFLKGRLEARLADGVTHVLHVGDPLYEGEALRTSARGFAVLAFKDKTRVTLQRGSHLVVSKVRFDPAKPGLGRMLLDLLAGGIRAASGLISKLHPGHMKVQTPVATITTRGTHFDVLCVGECGRRGARAQLPKGTAGGSILSALVKLLVRGVRAATANGLYVFTREGTVFVTQPDGKQFAIGQGNSALFTSAVARPVFNPPVPKGLLDRLGPAPWKVKIKEHFFRTRKVAVEPGLWVTVNNQGSVVVTRSGGQKIYIGEGQTGVATPRTFAVYAGGVPRFMRRDPYSFSPAIEVKHGALPATVLPTMPAGGAACQVPG